MVWVNVNRLSPDQRLQVLMHFRELRWNIDPHYSALNLESDAGVAARTRISKQLSSKLNMEIRCRLKDSMLISTRYGIMGDILTEAFVSDEEYSWICLNETHKESKLDT